MLGKIKDSAAYISRFLEGEKYRIGIILGTGLGELGKSIEIKHTIPYAGIPHFPVSTVQGHKEMAINREIRRKNVICNAGTVFIFMKVIRCKKSLFLIRVLHELGVKYLFGFQCCRWCQHSISGGRPDDHHRPYQSLPGTSAAREKHRRARAPLPRHDRCL